MTVVVEGGNESTEAAEVAEDIVEAASEAAETIVEAAVEAAEDIVEAAAEAAEGGAGGDVDRWVEVERRFNSLESQISDIAQRSWEAPSREEVAIIAEEVAETVAEEVAEEVADLGTDEGTDTEVTVVTPDVTEGKRKRRTWRDFY